MKKINAFFGRISDIIFTDYFRVTVGILVALIVGVNLATFLTYIQ